MQSTDTSTSLPDAASVLRELQQYLETTCRALDGEIRAYPTPIPRCDAQFNHLYEQRACVLRDLAALRSASTPRAALENVAREVLQHPPCGDSAEERRLRAILQAFRC